MKLSKVLASVLTGAVMAGGAVFAIAGPAAAIEEGPVQPGSILWFSTAGSLDTQVASNQVKSGTGTSRPWLAITTTAPCPAGTALMTPYIRIPQVGVPEDDWTEVQMGAGTDLKDSAGRFYGGQGDRITKPEVMTYLQANGGRGEFPLLETCRDELGHPMGVFRNIVTITGTSSADLAWTIDSADMPKPASSTTLTASATAISAGDEVTLTAAVSPSAATGDVEFFAGTTSLGTAAIAGGSASLATTALPVGTVDVTASYGGGSHSASTSAPVSITVAPAVAADTTTTLAVDLADGAPYQDVTLTATVAATKGTPAGTVQFKDNGTLVGSAPVAAGSAAITKNTFMAGQHSFTAEFVPASGAFNGSASAVVPASYASQSVDDAQSVVVTIPTGAITITTPYTPAAPLDLGVATLDPATSTYSASAPFSDIVITDTRAGGLGWTASVVAGDFVNGASTFGGQFAGLTGVAVHQVAGNALQAADVVPQDNAPVAPGLSTPKVFATYPAGKSIGTANLDGVFRLAQVPTSVAPGLFTSTVTFSVI